MLIHEEDNDYLMPQHEDECWITVKPFNLHIQRINTDTLAIDIWSSINLTENNPINSITVYHTDNDYERS